MVGGVQLRRRVHRRWRRLQAQQNILLLLRSAVNRGHAATILSACRSQLGHGEDVRCPTARTPLDAVCVTGSGARRLTQPAQLTNDGFGGWRRRRRTVDEGDHQMDATGVHHDIDGRGNYLITRWGFPEMTSKSLICQKAAKFQRVHRAHRPRRCQAFSGWHARGPDGPWPQTGPPGRQHQLTSSSGVAPRILVFGVFRPARSDRAAPAAPANHRRPAIPCCSASRPRLGGVWSTQRRPAHWGDVGLSNSTSRVAASDRVGISRRPLRRVLVGDGNGHPGLRTLSQQRVQMGASQRQPDYLKTVVAG